MGATSKHPVGLDERGLPADPGVVVGVDGSTASDDALDWALGEAALRGRPVTVVRAGDAVRLERDEHGRREAALAESAAEALAKARARRRAAERPRDEAGAAAPGSAVGVTGSARHVLVEAAEVADLVVVGRRGAGLLGRLVLGSVATAVLHHARGPVAVVPAHWVPWTPVDPLAAEQRRVVAGFDGSAESRSALRLAATEAALRGLPLEVVYAWQIVTLSPVVTATPGYAPPLAEFEAHAERVLAGARQTATAVPGAPEVRTVAVHGAPAAALLAACAGADLLVVGARGTGGFAELLLGSVSSQVAHHAPCPVVVVREGEERLPAQEGRP